MVLASLMVPFLMRSMVRAKGQFNNLQDFIRTQILRARGIFSRKNMDDFVGKAGSGQKTDERLQRVDLVPDFFFDFSLGTIPWVFAGLEFARGDFIDITTDGVTILSNHDDGPVVLERHDGRGPRMGDEFHVGHCPIRQRHGLDRQLNDFSLIDWLLHGTWLTVHQGVSSRGLCGLAFGPFVKRQGYHVRGNSSPANLDLKRGTRPCMG